MENEMKEKVISNEEAFCIAYWAFKRNEREKEPTGEEFKLEWCVAESYARQCHIEFERHQTRHLPKAKKTAVAA